MKNHSLALTFDDVLLVPRYSEVIPSEVSLRAPLTRRIQLNMPLLSAAMDMVTEAKLAIALAQEGGLGILHKNMTIAAQAAQVRWVKKFESGVIQDPVTVSPDTSLAECLAMRKQYNFSGMPVVDQGQLVGIITNRDVRFATDQGQLVRDLMTPKERLVTVPEGTDHAKVVQLMQQHRIEKILVIDKSFQLRGMITVRDILQDKEKPLACKDDLGRLRVGAAVGTSADTLERVAALVAEGVDVVVVDTAHGHSSRVIAMVREVKQQYPELDVIAGNIATADAAIALKEAGADAVKVGIGPGSICTTRVIAGVGVPQISAIQDVAQALLGSDVSVIADGGIRYSGDIAKAIAAGAHAVMVGSLFAGTEESPGEVELYQGRSYKTYRGMGSLAAMAQAQGSKDRYFQDAQSEDKLVPEGVEGRVPYKGTLLAVVQQLMGGLRSSMGYTGSKNLSTMRDDTPFVRISAAGVRESHVHDVRITKEAPNYHSMLLGAVA